MSSAPQQSTRPLFRTLVFAIAAAVALGLSGCATTSGSNPEPRATESSVDQQVVVADAPSEEQLKAVQDNEVSEDEYLAGFESYRACLSAAGYELLMNKPRGDLLDYGVPDMAVQSGVDARCYGRDFEQIDMIWQMAHPSSSDTVALLTACLQERGVTPSDDLSKLEDQVRELGMMPSDCNK